MAAPLRSSLRASSKLSSSTHCPHRCLLSSNSKARARVQHLTKQEIQSAEQSISSDHSRRHGPSSQPSSAWFAATDPLAIGFHSERPRDPNKVKLGKTLRLLQDRLPTLLQSPLPQDILSPNISLQLFPSTHPHLPTVSGRVAYNAALWTSPIAWNRVPIIGNVKLEILAERMTSEPLTFLPRHPDAIPDQLVVRWCEKRRGPELSSSGSGIARTLGLARGVDPNKAFTGLFIFDFDSEGRILTHTIEQVQESGNWEKGMGAKFVGLTDWLLGGMREPGGSSIPAFARQQRSK